MTKAKTNTFEVLLNAGDFEGARRQAQEAIAADPGDRKGLLALAKIELLEGSLDSAAVMATRAAIIEEDLDSLLVQAAIAAQTRTFEEAKTLYQRAQAKGRSAAGAFGLGQLYASAGQYVLAAEQFRAAVGQEPNEGLYRLQLGRALLATDQLVEALPHLEKSLQLAPSLPGPYDTCVRIMLEFGFVAQAETMLRQGLKLLPDQPLLMSRLCDVLVAKGDAAGALQIALDLAKQYPDDTDVLTNAARLLAATGNLAEARNVLTALFAQGQVTAKGRALQGQIFEAMDPPNENGAIAAYVAAAKADHRDWGALNNLGHLLMRRAEGDAEENLAAAREALEEARRRSPTRLEPVLNLALLAARQLKKDEARGLAAEVVAKASPVTQQELTTQAQRLLAKL